MNEEQEQKLNELHSAVVGNEKLRQKGLVERVESIEQWRSGVMLKVAAAGGGATVAVFVLKYLLGH